MGSRANNTAVGVRWGGLYGRAIEPTKSLLANERDTTGTILVCSYWCCSCVFSYSRRTGKDYAVPVVYHMTHIRFGKVLGAASCAHERSSADVYIISCVYVGRVLVGVRRRADSEIAAKWQGSPKRRGVHHNAPNTVVVGTMSLTITSMGSRVLIYVALMISTWRRWLGGHAGVAPVTGTWIRLLGGHIRGYVTTPSILRQ